MSGSPNSPRAYLVMTNVSPDDWCMTIDEQRKVLGRGREADIRVASRFRYVSRRHLEIWADRQHLMIRDLGSTSGTRINGVWIEQSEEVRIALGDRIWMGGLELEVVEEVSTMAQVIAESGMNMQEAFPLTDELGAPLTHNTTMTLPDKFLMAELTHAELEVILWMGRGYIDDQELGKALHRSPNTIRTQMNSIFRKLHVHSRGEVVGWLKRPK